MGRQLTPYEDIIDLPHHTSATRRRMPAGSRAAQFAPFAALTGYDDIIGETARLTGERLELSEDRQDRINAALRYLLEHIHERPEAEITFFVPDKLKPGGEYRRIRGAVRRIDECLLTVIFADGSEIPVADIYDIRGEFLPTSDIEGC